MSSAVDRGRARTEELKADWNKIGIFALWVLGSLLAIAILADQPYVGLAVAILVGIGIGIASVRAYAREKPELGKRARATSQPDRKDKEPPSED